jgi:hypothetical protein
MSEGVSTPQRLSETPSSAIGKYISQGTFALENVRGVDFAGVSHDLLSRRQLECDLVAPQILGTPRTRVPDDLHLKCAGQVRGKQTSLERLAPG